MSPLKLIAIAGILYGVIYIGILVLFAYIVSRK